MYCIVLQRARHFTPRKYWLITQEAVAPSRHDWKIVDWDVKPQHKQSICIVLYNFCQCMIDAPCFNPSMTTPNSPVTGLNANHLTIIALTYYLDRVKRIWYLSPMRAAKVQASLRIRPVSPEPPLLAQTSRESRGTFRQKARSLAPLNDWACAVKICHDGMLEDTNSLDGAHLIPWT